MASQIIFNAAMLLQLQQHKQTGRHVEVKSEGSSSRASRLAQHRGRAGAGTSTGENESESREHRADGQEREASHTYAIRSPVSSYSKT
mmetsp:Transcript_81954/g.171505  ORF Transcript_81954/g.171505 Transcript_81954/m.171505 type:complete len:88 (-) Transcript_81954:58-321(-)